MANLKFDKEITALLGQTQAADRSLSMASRPGGTRS